MGFRNLEQQQAAIEAADTELERRKTIEDVYAKYPGTLIRCMANDRIIIEIIAWLSLSTFS